MTFLVYVIWISRIMHNHNYISIVSISYIHSYNDVSIWYASNHSVLWHLLNINDKLMRCQEHANISSHVRIFYPCFLYCTIFYTICWLLYGCYIDSLQKEMCYIIAWYLRTSRLLDKISRRNLIWEGMVE